MMTSEYLRVLAGGAYLAVAPALSWGCATCGCTLNADAAMGYAASAGLWLNVEYDYIHQDQLRSGTQTESVVAPGNELEHDTLNRYLTLGLAYSPAASWRFDLKAPYVIRTHSTYGTYDPTVPIPDLSTSRSSSLGDVRVIASYQGSLPTRNLGLQLGIKLPTGHYGTRVQFSSGPLAGTPLDASLQPGTGSTDVILGAYYFVPISQDFDLTATAQFQSALSYRQDQPGNDYRPGNAATLSVGLRYAADPRWIPQLQLNLSRKSADQGALADTADTAGTVAYLSPGATVRVTHTLYVFGFVQLPVYSNLDGNQLFPHYTISVGASYGF